MGTGLLFGVFLAAALAVAWFHLRHLPLAVLAVGMPLLGAAAALLVPAIGTVHIFTGASFGILFALLIADEIVLRVSGGEPRREAAASAWRRYRTPLLLYTFASLVAPLTMRNYALAAAIAGGALFAFGTMRLAFLMPFGEDWITRANRFREWAERGAGALAPVTRPRYGFSVAGIALVLTVIAVSQWRGVFAPNLLSHAVPLGGTLVAALVAGAVALRDWRGVLSAVLAAAPLVAATLWLSLRQAGFATDPSALVVTTFMAGCVLLFVGASFSAGYSREGDDATLASARMLNRHAVGFALTGMALCAGLALASLGAPEILPGLLALDLLGIAAALLFQPAFLIVIETLFPRRATLEARYRVR